MPRNRKRQQAENMKEAVASGKLKRTRKAVKSEARILAIAKDRYDKETFGVLASLHENGISTRDLLVLAQMEYIDVTHDMDDGTLQKGEGYRLRTQIIETLRKLAESETGGGAALPNLIQINIAAKDIDRKSDVGATLEMAS